mgnify:CR=1 FL=1
MSSLQLVDPNKEIADDKGTNLIFNSRREDLPQQENPLIEQADAKLVKRARSVGVLFSKWEKGDQERQEAVSLIKFGQYISELRRKQHLTRQQLAEQANVDPEYLFGLEKGLLAREEIEGLLRKIAEPLQSGPLALRRQMDDMFVTKKGE